MLTSGGRIHEVRYPFRNHARGAVQSRFPRRPGRFFHRRRQLPPRHPGHTRRRRPGAVPQSLTKGDIIGRSGVGSVRFCRGDDGVLERCSEVFREIVRQMRAREETATRHLDVPASIRATIDNVGLIALRHRTRTKPHEYLILVDRISARDHQFHWFDALAEALRSEDVDLVRYWFDHDPRICVEEASTTSSAVLFFKQLYRTRPARRPEPTCFLGVGRIRTALAFLNNLRARDSSPEGALTFFVEEGECEIDPVHGGPCQ